MATINELMRYLAPDTLQSVGASLAPGVAVDYFGNGVQTEAGMPVYSGKLSNAGSAALSPYSFDWRDTGKGNTGTLTASRDGKQVGQWDQQDQSFGEALTDWGMMMGAAFGGLGAAGMGPLAGAFGGASGAAGVGGAAGASGAALAAPTAAELTALLPGAVSSGAAGSAGALAPTFASLAGPSAGSLTSLLPGASSAAGAAGAVGGGNFLTSLMPSLGNVGLGSLTNKDLLGLGGNLLSGYMQNRAAGKVADAQMAGINSSNDLLRHFYDTTRADYAPMREAAYAGLSGYQNLLKDPSSIIDNPGYRFGLSEGTKAMDNSAAARGGLYSGAAVKAAQRYGQDYAGTKFNDALGRYGTLAGLGTPGLTATTNAGQATAGALSNNAMTAGNVRGSQFVGQSNAWSDAISNMLEGQQNQGINALLLKRLGG